MSDNVIPKEINLIWEGPFTLSGDHPEERFKPPEVSGVYIWTIAEHLGYKLAYIGQTSNLRERFHQHILYTLGGGYELYKKDYFRKAIYPSKDYGPGFDGIVSDFVVNFESRSKLAYENLMSYQFFWTPVNYSTKVLESIESALISRVQECKETEQALQNGSPSRLPHSSVKIRLPKPFPSQIANPELVEEICYGELAFPE
ncbi:MAG: hypothetical protein WBM02_00425 [bacterium]